MDKRMEVSILSGGRIAPVVLALAALSACGGGSNSTNYTIGGSASGLSGTLVLQNNGGDNLTVTGNGAFSFNKKVQSGGAYVVTVATQPAGQTCTVASGSGTASANVTSVAVTCATNPPPLQTYSIGGTVSGMSGGTLQLGLQHPGNMGNSIDVTTNGPFNFDPDKVTNGDNYIVTIQGQPSGQTCAVTNGNGTVAAANVSNVTVNCSAASSSYTLGGTISGLQGAGLKLEDTAANVRQVAASETTFTLPNAVGNNFEYNVGISQQPLSQTCVLLKSHGVVSGANVTNIDVRCIDNVTTPIVGTYTIPALSADDTSYVYMTLFADGVYIYGSVENHVPCGENNGNGVEYGVYNYSLETGQFTIMSAVVDTNGACGLWDSNGSRINGTLSRTGSGQSRVLTLTTGLGQLDLVPVESTTGQIVGSWSPPYQKSFVAFLPAGGTSLYTFWAETQADNAPTSIGQIAGVEYGCALTTALTGGTFTPNLTSACLAPAPSTYGPVDTHGIAGISSFGGSQSFTVSTDAMTAGEFQTTRIKPN